MEIPTKFDKICPLKFRPKRTFMKSIPAAAGGRGGVVVIVVRSAVTVAATAAAAEPENKQNV
jgi:hypothetical protein